MIALLLIALIGIPEDPADNGLPDRTFDTRSDPRFGDPTGPLRVYLNRRYNRAHRGAQHFCIVGYVGSDGGRMAEIHWREGRQMIRWNGASDPLWRDDSIVLSPGKLDLRRDVVATEADIAGSTYLVTRAWVAQVLRDCAAKGMRYTLRR